MLSGPQDSSNVVTPVEAELTPDLAAPGRDPRVSRLEQDLSSTTHPVEPATEVQVPRRSEQALRDATMFSIISRDLFRNRANGDILRSLTQAGYEISERSLQRIYRRPEFIVYYDKFRNQLLEPLDKQIREDLKMAMPEAYNHVVRLMRSAASEKVQLDAAIGILRGGGGMRDEAISKKPVFNVPESLQKALVKEGQELGLDEDD